MHLNFASNPATQAPATVVTASSSSDLSPMEAAIMDACNELHDARATGDLARARGVRARLFDLIERYEETDADNHPNPAWARPNQRALALSADGQLAQAIAAEQIALRYADTPRRREISLDNLADRCTRAGRHDEALGYFFEALEVAPASIPVLMTGALALHAAGHADQADAIFASLLTLPGQLAPGGPLGAYLDCEDRLAAMAPELPHLRALFGAWSRAKAALQNGGAQ